MFSSPATTIRLCLAALAWAIVAANSRGANPVVLSPQWITLPAGADAPLFIDVDGDGRTDLLIMDPAGKRVLNYHQRPGGFSHSPDQAIVLPVDCAWAALCDVDPHPGIELVMSAGGEVVYLRQNAGCFEMERRSLLTATQVFTNFDLPILTSLVKPSTERGGTGSSIPILTTGQVVWYRRNSAHEWSPGPTAPLRVEQTAWSLDRDAWNDAWALGGNAAQRLRVEQMLGVEPARERDQEPENETVRTIIADMKKKTVASQPAMLRVDVDGDGREDLMVWQVCGRMDFRTDIYVFIRGSDGHLPERPNQVLHCHGLPIPLGSRSEWSPVHDLKGNRTCELVLLELKTALVSASGLLETALSHGLDWWLTIRSFHGGAFSSNPDASVPLTMVLPAEVLSGWPIFLGGDFNGDGRPDLLVRRSDTQWNVFMSTTDGRWFEPQPAMTFDAPVHGSMEIQDLNGDGLADIIWHVAEKPDLCIFMSQANPPNAKKP